MPRIIKFSHGSQDIQSNIFQALWSFFLSRDYFTKSFLLILLLIIIATPFIVANRFSLRQRAEETTAPIPSDKFGLQEGGGIVNLNQSELDAALDDFKNIGAYWIRLDITWSVVQANGPDTWDWNGYDRVVNGANARGIKVLGLLAYTPSWIGPETQGPTDQQGYDRFAKYAEETVKHYSPMGVKHWELWNEPNNYDFWKPKPNAAHYTQLLKTTYAAIKKADPSTVVIAGSLAALGNDGTNITVKTFLQGMYDNGAKDYFDAISVHPYTFPYLPSYDDQFHLSGWQQMCCTTPSLRSIMVDHGDQDKKIWVTEYGAPTGGGSAAVDELRQGDILKEAYTLFSSYESAGPLFWFKYKDLCIDTLLYECWHGLVRHDGSKKSAYFTYQRLALGSSLSPTITLTPTPIPTATPTPIPLMNTPTPTPTPTPIPATPTNTPTPIPTATPTPRPTSTPIPTPTATPIPLAADVDRNGCVGIVDFQIWSRFFIFRPIPPLGMHLDINDDGAVNILDFNKWHQTMRQRQRLCP